MRFMMMVKADKDYEAGVPPSPELMAAIGKLGEDAARAGELVEMGGLQGGPMFGKRLSEYLAFQKVWLILIAAVGLARLGLSLAGLPDSTVTFLSMTVVGWAAVLYYGVAVHTRGFGSYQQLLPLMVFQVVLVQAIAVAGILLAIFGFPNIYAAPEYSGPPFARSPNQWAHILAHLTIGIVAPVLLWWGVASLVLLITKKVARPAVA